MKNVKVITSCILGVLVGSLLGCANTNATPTDPLQYLGRTKTDTGYIDTYARNNWTDVYVLYENGKAVNIMATSR